MPQEVLDILEAGGHASLQDRGRTGWRRFGVPTSGAMDGHAAAWANRVLSNPEDAPVLEFLPYRVRLRARRCLWICATGAAVETDLPGWRAVRLREGEQIEFRTGGAGVWCYLAVEGGFQAPRVLGSASAYARGGLGTPVVQGNILHRQSTHEFQLPQQVAGRSVAPSERRDYNAPPPLRVWPGPQWNSFPPASREQFFGQDWTISTRGDRVGYRLEGPAMGGPPEEIVSEPVLVGSIQIPGGGQPIVTMRDGPTVGGYPKLGLVDPDDVSWLAQCRPGTAVRFRPLLEVQRPLEPCA